MRAGGMCLLLFLASCAGGQDVYRYQSVRQGDALVGVDFRLNVGRNHLEKARSTEDRREVLRRLLLEAVDDHGDCEAGVIDGYMYGSYQGAAEYYIGASCIKQQRSQGDEGG